MVKSNVTVLMATNKVNQWLTDAVESVLNSDDSTLILLVLDGVKIGGEKWATNSRVETILLEKSTGLADALNVGLAQIKTKYVARLDADDIAVPERFLWQAEYLENNPKVALVCGLANLIDENSASLGFQLPRIKEFETDLSTKLLERNPIIHPAVMYRTHQVKGLGGYSPGLSAMEDYELWLRLAVHGTIVTVQKEAINYRVHSGQMTRSAAPLGKHITLISKNRLKLAARLKISLLRVLFLVSMWLGYQFFRFAKTAISDWFRGK